MPLFAFTNLAILHLPPLDLSLSSGQILAVSGNSGCGKSLLLRALADLDPHSGELFLNDEPASSYSPWQWRRQVGLLPSESSWWLARVRDHFPGHGPDIYQELAELGLSADILDTPTHRLSSGERQRLSLLRLLRNKPAVLLLDEPTANLDNNNTALVERRLKRYQQINKAIIILVTHDVAQAQRLADRHLLFTKDEVREIKHKAGE